MNPLIARSHIEAVAAQIAPMCDGDSQLLQDMLEGETDLLKIVGQLHEMRAADLETLCGIRERKSDLALREARLKNRAERIKGQIGVLLRSAQLGKIELTEATYSVRNGTEKLEIVDANAVPEKYQRTKREPNKTKINDAFADAEKLPNWLTIQPASDVVTARTK